MFITRAFYVALVILTACPCPAILLAEGKDSVPSSASALLQTPGLSDRPATPSKAAEIHALWNANKKADAEKMLQAWIKSEKKSPAPLVASASLRYEEGRYKKTLDLAEKALDKFPQCADAYYWRGRAFESLNKPMDAANEFRAALLIQKEFADAQTGLDRVLLKIDPAQKDKQP